jgi:hypothetical protein
MGTKSFEEYLAERLVFPRILKEVSIDMEEDNIYALCTVSLGKDKSKKYKVRLSPDHLFGLAADDYYDMLVGTDLMREGYLLITVEGGWIVKKGETEYQIHEDECTCGDFTFNKRKCKHLRFRDMMVKYQRRVNIKS